MTLSVRLRAAARCVRESAPSGVELPYVALEHVESGAGKFLAGFEPDQKAAGSEVVFHRGDVLFGKLRPYLAKVFAADFDGCASGEFLVLRPGPDLHPRFLYYLCLSRPFLDWAEATSVGTRMPRTDWHALSSFRFGLPPISQQVLIVAFLDREIVRIDTLVSARNRMLALAEERFGAIVEHGLGIDRYPRERLGRVCGGVTVGVVVNPSIHVVEDGPVLYFRGLNVRPFELDLKNAQRMTLESNSILQKSTLRAGDIVCIRVGDPGIAAVVPPEADGANCASLLIVRRSKYVDSAYLCHVFNSRFGRGQFGALAQGAAQLQVNATDAVDFQVPMPPLKVQERIAESLNLHWEKLNRLRIAVGNQVALLRERQRALISAAVTGRIDARGAS